jgi:sugar lactone lactonase YvrE
VRVNGSQPMELVLGGLGFGEGPRWHDDRLWFSDLLRRRVYSLGEDGVLTTELELDDRPSGLGWLPDGRLLAVAMDQRALLRREPSGELVLHADLSGVATSHANDMVVAADGTAYVGNFGSDVLAGEPLRESDLAVVHPDGSVDVGPGGLWCPNGSVITPDGALLIVGESRAERYQAFPILADGSLGPGRVWAVVEGRVPDGCTLDAEGAIWFADAGGQEVLRIAEGGEILDSIQTPDPAFACMLGGASGHSLFILTCSTRPVPGAEIGTGRLWRVDATAPKAGWP